MSQGHRADICTVVYAPVTMRMSLSQPSAHMVVLSPLDQEAKAWYHSLQLRGDALPYYLLPDVACLVVDAFIGEGGVLTPH